MDLLTELRFSLRLLERRSDRLPEDIFAGLIARMELKYDALEKNTPVHH